MIFDSFLIRIFRVIYEIFEGVDVYLKWYFNCYSISFELQQLLEWGQFNNQEWKLFESA